MSKFTLVTLITLLSFTGAYAFNPTKGKTSALSIQLTNPISGASKIGGTVEMRIGGSALAVSFTDFIAAYQGKQYKFEYRKYIPTNRRNEYYWYLKAYGGEVTYHSEKLPLVGDETGTLIGPINYYGGGAGVGRRFNFNHIVILMNAGLKYTSLPENLPDESRESFRIFYATGPGSILDLNFKIGYQF